MDFIVSEVILEVVGVVNFLSVQSFAVREQVLSYAILRTDGHYQMFSLYSFSRASRT